MGLLTTLLTIFVVLKLTGLILWSWWAVTAPLWVPIAGILILWLVGLATITVSK